MIVYEGRRLQRISTPPNQAPGFRSHHPTAIRGVSSESGPQDWPGKAKVPIICVEMLEATFEIAVSIDDGTGQS